MSTMLSSSPLETALPPATGARALPVAAGNVLRVLQAAAESVRDATRATLAVVLETEGSTYVDTGAMALFADDAHVGWLSGGCLEPEIATRAHEAGALRRIGWIELDTRDDEALLTGSAIGCRGRLRIALLPLHALDGIEAVLDDWIGGGQDLSLAVSADGSVEMATPQAHRHWTLDASPIDWVSATRRWSLCVHRPPEALILGAGPETPVLAPLLRDLGWRVRIAERRPRWRPGDTFQDALLDMTPAHAIARVPQADAVLVMHHHFELDREALEALAAMAVPFIGLLGPPRRREDLFRLLTPARRAALQPRLRSPVGIDLGGRGPEAIALSIAAQMQAWRHGAAAA